MRNTATNGSSALTLLFADVYIEDTQFFGNTATDRTDNIFAIFSNVTIVGSSFAAFRSVNANPSTSLDLTSKKGSFIFASS